MNSPYTLHLGDCLETLRGMPDNSVDSIVTDPPYGLSQHSPEEVLECLKAWLAGEVYQPKGKGFMGKSWDAWVPGPEVWREVLRVLKPGGHVLAFAGTRSMDLMSMAIRLAGFELRDSIGYANDGGGAPLLAWTFGSGFPKSHDVSKAIDREAGADREVVLSVKAGRSGSEDETQSGGRNYRHGDDRSITAPATEAARQWQGWGTALKPAWEPIILGRKPLGSGTVASNVLLYGTGALNIDGCRVGGDAGRWPANLIHDGSPEVLAGFPVTTSGGGPKPGTPRTKANTYGEPTVSESLAYGSNTGSAARFYYCAKASKRDRDEGLEGFALSAGTTSSMTSRAERERGIPREESAGARNHHPTVKPTNLMAYLVRLVTPPGGTVLDPFMGSGSTGKAAIREGFRFIGCELSPEYLAIAEARITHEVAKIEAARAPAAPAPQPDLFATP
jgi:site-specific DNA-methyltransferase (adenine-specific)